MSKQVTVTELPPCDFCRENGVKKLAEYDFRTRFGSWANGCARHWQRYRASEQLGTGLGQRLVDR